MTIAKILLPRPRAIIIGLTLVALAGCASYKRIDEAPELAAQAADDLAAQAQAQRNSFASGAIRRLSQPWVSQNPIKQVATRPKLPGDRDCRLRLVIDAPMSLQELAQIISADCQLPVRITPDALGALAGAYVSGPGQTPRPSLTPAAAEPAVPALAEAAAVPGMPAAQLRPVGTLSKIQPLRWIGQPLSGLLDVVCSQLGLTWNYRSGAIVFSYLDTRTFNVGLPSDMTFSSAVARGSNLRNTGGMGGFGGMGGEAASSSTGETNQATSVSWRAEFDSEFRASIESLMTPSIGRYALSSTSGKLTVTDTPDALDRIAAYVDEVNAAMRRRASLYVTVATVTFTDADSLGFNWNAVWRSVTGNFGMQLANGFTPLDGGLSAGFGILETATGSAAQFAGTQAILSALRRQGSVQITRQRGVITDNRQPTPISLTSEQQYVCGQQAINTIDVGTSESIQMCSAVSGLAMDMIPSIEGDEVTLQFTSSMSPTPVITPVEGLEDRAIKEARSDSQVFSQRVTLRSGQTMVLSDYQEVYDSATKEGVGGLSAWAVTGGGTREQTRRIVVIIISAQVMPDDGSNPTTRAGGAHEDPFAT